jgi:hypothetical protein
VLTPEITMTSVKNRGLTKILEGVYCNCDEMSRKDESLTGGPLSTVLQLWNIGLGTGRETGNIITMCQLEP